ncbi:tRNA (adenine(22)-N(1))-methyltransferase [Paenibacillus farraposensis]|uniref:tRNA (Adenine(22)-N(1))-methyltransferase n=1 Tax=Paenibacillus farraposensis TaxID=2807095 RepID=A0ABW4DB18_9BACL|nr:tRNA (adenine(22)-N(1))-methyltransferase TrmK [Paenibacillus farraposensis]MCC3380056.1 tRNA (adenine-N(1))-methyltransferase [Paenibacillus farraposensis]
MKLSQRLQYIMEQIPAGSRLADIGSDHGLLPVAAVRSGRVPQAVAGEVNDGPLRAAQKQVAEAGLTDRIMVRKGDGLAVIKAHEVDVITIAGMGGALITSILEQGKDKLASVKQLVLQPNVGEDILRRWLMKQQWVLIDEHIMEEDGKIYEILTAVPASASDLKQDELYRPLRLPGSTLVLNRDWLMQLGPLLVNKPNEIFFRKWQLEIRKLQAVLAQVSRSELEAAQHKQEQLRKQIEQLEEVLACLPKDKL